MDKLPKIYIIVNAEDNKSLVTKLKIKKVEKRLIKRGFGVVNPCKIYEKKSISTTEATLYNIKKLITCEAVYIMPEVSLKKGDNLELQISIDLNLIILQGLPIKLEYKSEFLQIDQDKS